MPRLHSRLTPFLGAPVRPPQPDPQVLMLAQYDLRRFSPALFQHHGVACPNDLLTASDKRQAEYLAGRMLARQALTAQGRTPLCPGRGPLGEPVWGVGMRGSISHSKGCVGVWLAQPPYHPGLDIEHLASDRQIAAIRQVVLTRKEQGLALSDRSMTSVFSGKEALYKALFPQVKYRFGFSAAELTDPPTTTGARLCLTRDLTAEIRQGDCYEIRFEWSGDRVISQCLIQS